jgi:acyl-CoA synthetase (NDP forming)/GNAT superfamily N-acetyltransferase
VPEPVDVLLTDGSIAVIRTVRPDDSKELHRLHQGLCDESYRLRFFGLGRDTADRYVDHLLRDNTLAMVLVLHCRIVALATAELTPPDSAEVAFLVEDGHHGQGIGSLLLEHLAVAARDRGVARFEADVLVENYAMLAVLTDAGFTYQRHTADGVVTVHLDTLITATTRSAIDARDRRAEARSLHPILYPRSVAILGVRSDGTGVGRAVLNSIRQGGFTGRVCVVHPEAVPIDGVEVYPDLAAAPEPLDLAVIAVPAQSVLGALEAAADAGVPGAVVISAGFQEVGKAGAALQRDLAELARSRGVRVVGPNCLGVLSNHPDIRLNATFNAAVPPSGGLAVATQSGGVGIVVADLARELGLGIGSLVSLGNKVDVSGNDLLAAWTDDPLVSAAAFYLESFGNAPKFARLARRFAEHKPLLAVVGGRSAPGQRAGASHTAAAATPAVGVSALFAQAGVIGCEDAEELAEAALLLTREPLPHGDRIAVVSNAGGMGILATDAAVAHGLSVPTLSAAARARVARHVSGTAGTANPVDAGAGVEAPALAAIVEEVISSGEVDAVLVVLVATGLASTGPVLEGLSVMRDRHAGVPLVLVTHGFTDQPPATGTLTRLRSSASAVRAMARAAWYAGWLGERTAEMAAVAGPRPEENPSLTELMQRRETALRLLEQVSSAEGWVGAVDAAELLEPYGLRPSGTVVVGADAAADAARALGFPVAVKVAAADVVHRTDHGLVRVGVDSVDDVRAVVASYCRQVGRPDLPVLVQPVVAGIELAVGVVRDPTFGPLVMVGAGGVNTDVLSDRAYMLPPLHAGDVRRALRGLRCWPLLEGYRGSPAADIDSLVDVVLAVAALAHDVPAVAEMDLNPVIVTRVGSSLVDVKLRLRYAASDADAPRQLSPRRRDDDAAAQRMAGRTTSSS